MITTKDTKQPETKDYEDALKKYIVSSNNIVAKVILSHYDESHKYKQDEYNLENPYWSGSLYPITNVLLYDSARYCEHYVSDVLITLSHMQNCISKNKFDTTIFGFGIRQNGIDSINYIACNMNNNTHRIPNGYYRKLYAVEIQEHTNDIDNSPELHILLKDISNISLYDIHKMFN